MDKPMSRSANNIVLLFLWLAACVIAMILAMNMDTASFVDGQYIPVGNDSFYHARRILDAAISERGFYQFDVMMHVPEGSWITWPWAYDFLMAMALVVGIKTFPASEPMAFLAHVPVAWVIVNAGLMMLICRRMALRTELTAIVMLAFAISPLTQSLHGLGVIDHHFVELSFMLATVWLGLGYFETQQELRSAIAYGLVLAVAPAFHNGLFILQLPGLIIAFVLWLQQRSVDIRHVRTFSITLFVGTIAVLIPSGPFRDMQFEFSTLSWFHLYIAACTGICSYYMAATFTQSFRKKVPIFLLLVFVLSLPVLVKISQGLAFISGSTILLDSVTEVKSPLRMFLDANNSLAVTRYYSWLIILSPVVLIIYLFRLTRIHDVRQTCFAIFVVFGLLLLLAQYRLHPFGFWALVIGPFVLLNDLTKEFQQSRVAIAAGCLAAIAIAFQPPLRHQLFEIFPAGLTKDYAASRSMFPILQTACEEGPGTVLAYSDDGHPIRYHSECSVIANNFLLTEQHGQKIVAANILLNLMPEQLVEIAPDVRYVFVRLYGLFGSGPDGPVPTPIDELKSINAPLFSELMFRKEVPENYSLLGELRVEDDRDIPFVRVFRIDR